MPRRTRTLQGSRRWRRPTVPRAARPTARRSAARLAAAVARLRRAAAAGPRRVAAPLPRPPRPPTRAPRRCCCRGSWPASSRRCRAAGRRVWRDGASGARPPGRGCLCNRSAFEGQPAACLQRRNAVCAPVSKPWTGNPPCGVGTSRPLRVSARRARRAATDGGRRAPSHAAAGRRRPLLRSQPAPMPSRDQNRLVSCGVTRANREITRFSATPLPHRNAPFRGDGDRGDMHGLAGGRRGGACRRRAARRAVRRPARGRHDAEPRCAAARWGWRAWTCASHPCARRQGDAAPPSLTPPRPARAGRRHRTGAARAESRHSDGAGAAARRRLCVQRGGAGGGRGRGPCWLSLTPRRGPAARVAAGGGGGRSSGGEAGGGRRGASAWTFPPRLFQPARRQPTASPASTSPGHAGRHKGVRRAGRRRRRRGLPHAGQHHRQSRDAAAAAGGGRRGCGRHGGAGGGCLAHAPCAAGAHTHALRPARSPTPSFPKA
jgi:hypothetical protein